MRDPVGPGLGAAAVKPAGSPGGYVAYDAAAGRPATLRNGLGPGDEAMPLSGYAAEG
jgi:hypothetical protein